MFIQLRFMLVIYHFLYIVQVIVIDTTFSIDPAEVKREKEGQASSGFSCWYLVFFREHCEKGHKKKTVGDCKLVYILLIGVELH